MQTASNLSDAHAAWRKTEAGAAALLVASLLGAVVWSVVAQLSMPSWFRPEDDCERRFAADGPCATIDASFFPPQARCVFVGGVRRDFIPAPLSWALAVCAIGLVVGSLAGIAILGRLYFREAFRANPAPETIPGARRSWLLAVVHVTGAALFGGGLTYAGPFVLLAVAIFGEMPGVVAMLALMIVVSVWIATALDEAVGPDRFAGLASRWRGLVVGVSGVTAVVALVFAFDEPSKVLEHPGCWPAVAAAVFGILAASEWGVVRFLFRRRAAG